MKLHRAKHSPDFAKWAEHAVKGLENSHAMLGIYNKGSDRSQLFEFALQIGLCLLEEKPIVLLAPEGTSIPDKLLAAAGAVEFYQAENMESFKQAMHRAADRVGIAAKPN